MEVKGHPLDVKETSDVEIVDGDQVKLTIRLPKDFVKQIDFLVLHNDFPSRSEAIRTAVRDMLYTRLDLVLPQIERQMETARRMDRIQALEKEYMKR